jgi:hypothetical protein
VAQLVAVPLVLVAVLMHMNNVQLWSCPSVLSHSHAHATVHECYRQLMQGMDCTVPFTEVHCQTVIVQVCSKQYQTAMELEEHLSSYDHHHKKVRQKWGAISSASPCSCCSSWPS